MSEQSPLVPEWEALGIVEDDSAEPEDANVEHAASVEEVDALEEQLEEDNED